MQINKMKVNKIKVDKMQINKMKINKIKVNKMEVNKLSFQVSINFSRPTKTAVWLEQPFVHAREDFR